MRQTFGQQHEATTAVNVTRGRVSDLEFVTKEGNARLYDLAKIILNFWWDDHLGREPHRAVRRSAPEQVPRISCPVVPGRTNGLGSVHQGAIREERQELDGVEDVGLSDAVGACDARKGPELNGETSEVLEAMNL